MSIASDAAIGSGDAQTAFRAIDLLEQQYAFDATELRLTTAEQLVPKAKVQADNLALHHELKILLSALLKRDDFDRALEVHTRMVELARMRSDRALLARAHETKESIEAMKKLRAQIPDAIKQLEADAENPQANLTYGSYLCLIKNRWKEGLPLLARGSDVRLRMLAMIDLEPDRPLDATLQLADQYWEMGQEAEQPERLGYHRRAAQLYASIVERIAGLERAKALKRLADFKKIYENSESGPGTAAVNNSPLAAAD